MKSAKHEYIGVIIIYFISMICPSMIDEEINLLMIY